MAGGMVPTFCKGLHTLQGLYPWVSASLGDLKYSTFSFLGFRAVQVGRQNIPVVLIAAKNCPSNCESFLRRALYIRSFDNVVSIHFILILVKARLLEIKFQPKT